ncbi:XrtA/PEP-CTERM system histidine kinase PrsK [Sphingomonas corticis]|jgi:putative PEP-CTERM system histidine kinase|uniref:histidine kinase n=1 Tax=Sphingomonas corticis TaxID=2722791 RepID=A0ABX1CS44_9SPHN|nr:XrtA/PEP-CTERM system histidine kinase PrsK [Sphingomonas corticis]NJR79222.1 PEP-CTERM system histidine kinase PrsK [Sphingomonas corticis]
MQGAIIWCHALAAMLLAGVAAAQVREPVGLVQRAVLAAALLLSALWALGVAGIGGGDVAVSAAGTARDLGWLAALFLLTPAARWRGGAFVAIAACMVLAASLRIAAEHVAGPSRIAMTEAMRALHMLAAAAALVLAGRTMLSARARGGVDVLAGALALLFGAELAVDAVAWAAGGWRAELTLARGLALALVGVLIAVRDGRRRLRLSRAVVLQAVALGSAALVVVALVAGSGLIAALGGAQARVALTAFAVGTGATLATLLSTRWLRAWLRVVVSKHLFTHRYDYRSVWMRFAATLVPPAEAPRPLAERAVTAMAELTDSPAGLLLRIEDNALVAGAAWRWEDAPREGADAALARHLAATGRIVALDEVRAGSAPAGEAAAVPDWLVATREAWGIVPLLHGERLVGAMVLARPLVDRPLDWEDFDLLGVAARQVASYLAEDDAHAALAEARRFEEFNRRFAFLMHDLKNLVSQMALVARNAERHAENPAFRADMIATLRDTSQRMDGLLARLSHRPAAVAEPPRAVPLRALAERIADARRAQHGIEVIGGEVVALAEPAALETVLGHLIQNAVEASDPGSRVVLAIGGAGDRALLEVIDRGCGMDAGFVRDALFRPFVSGKANGFGLGAYEARQLVAAMGGSLTVSSRTGEGTRFRIALPRAAAGERVAERAA